jgi:hypothetical protein
MPVPLDAPTLFDQQYLEIRARLLEVASALDRVDRASGSVEGDPRMKKIREAIGMLSSPDADRAEQLQLIFSLQYDDAWREKYAL